ncbi:hypothetical protein HETIRDRAFT_148152, partial [Heterobasidion irregulare TC 32-1]
MPGQRASLIDYLTTDATSADSVCTVCVLSVYCLCTVCVLSVYCLCTGISPQCFFYHQTHEMAILC